MGLERIRSWPSLDIRLGEDTEKNIHKIIDHLHRLQQELQDESFARVRDFEDHNRDTDLLIGTSKGIRAKDDNKRIEVDGSKTDAAGARVICYGEGHATLPGCLILDYGDYTAAKPAGTKATIRLMDDGGVTNVIYCDDSGQIGIGTDSPGSDFDASTKEAEFKVVTFASEYNNGNSGTAKTIDWGNGQQQKVTMTGNCTFTFTAPNGPGTFSLRLIQDGTGSRTATWPATVKWPGGSGPTLTAAADSVDMCVFKYNGTSYYGDFALNYS